eukprot:TRINITY_DN14956_c0_g1_i1.p2 TRINITY_DN14956_c0_g1~~TRINITY_DN14956_c0_g1_i1.p2  ORF type:complete len:189 (-),score=40.61 TRINITY_DN14956_c0_g1_i1:2569-3135(-)
MVSCSNRPPKTFFTSGFVSDDFCCGFGLGLGFDTGGLMTAFLGSNVLAFASPLMVAICTFGWPSPLGETAVEICELNFSQENPLLKFFALLMRPSKEDPAASAFSRASSASVAARDSCSDSFFTSSSSFFVATAASRAFSDAFSASSSAFAFAKTSAYSFLLPSSGMAPKSSPMGFEGDDGFVETSTT